jgi:hypothetical protein
MVSAGGVTEKLRVAPWAEGGSVYSMYHNGAKTTSRGRVGTSVLLALALPVIVITSLDFRVPLLGVALSAAVLCTTILLASALPRSTHRSTTRSADRSHELVPLHRDPSGASVR